MELYALVYVFADSRVSVMSADDKAIFIHKTALCILHTFNSYSASHDN